MSRSRTISGANIIFYINGAPLGRVSSMAFSIETPRKAIYGLDSGQPYELAALTTKILCNITLWRTFADGGAEGAGFLASSLSDIPNEKYFSVMIRDRATDITIFKADRCSSLNQNWNISHHRLIEGNISFEAINYANESSA